MNGLGNAYRMLVFLCANRNATLTQIGDFLDWAKEYSENHLRQYRYKINTLVGKGIIEYKNGVYSIAGDIKNADELTKNDRNTDLLQPNHVLSGWEKFMNKAKELQMFPAIAGIVILLMSFLSLPYGFYNFLRIIVTGVSVYYAYYLYSKELFNGWFWALLGIAVLFNPIAPIYIKDKDIWQFVDVVVAIFLAVLIYKLRKNE